MKITYKPSFVRQYSKLPEALRVEVKERIDLFRNDPKHPFLKTHKLKGVLKDFWSFSVDYQNRVVFMWESKDIAAFVAVGNHDVYRG